MYAEETRLGGLKKKKAADDPDARKNSGLMNAICSLPSCYLFIKCNQISCSGEDGASDSAYLKLPAACRRVGGAFQHRCGGEKGHFARLTCCWPVIKRSRKKMGSTQLQAKAI